MRRTLDPQPFVTLADLRVNELREEAADHRCAMAAGTRSPRSPSSRVRAWLRTRRAVRT